MNFTSCLNSQDKLTLTVYVFNNVLKEVQIEILGIKLGKKTYWPR